MSKKKSPEEILINLEKRRDLSGWIANVASSIAVSASIFHLYTAAGGQLFALSQRVVHLAFIGFLGLGLSAYLIPIMFIYDPALILIGEPLFIALSLATAVIGIISLSASIQGYFLDNLNVVERILFAAGAISLIYPGLLSDGVGVAILAIILGVHWQKIKNGGTKSMVQKQWQFKVLRESAQ